MKYNSLDDIKIVGIAGGGTMGVGIAQVFASSGYTTIVYDIEQGSLDNAEKMIQKNFAKAVEKGKMSDDQKLTGLGKISYTKHLADLKADLIIEAIIEKLEPKVELFTALADINSNECIFTTNTSSIPITRIARQLSDPHRLAGMHFFNPAHIMKLVEVIAGEETDREIGNTIRALAEKVGKQAVSANDAPGFIVNRVARHYYVESLKILEEHVASIEDIDDLMEASGFKMGPFRLMDLLGVDNNFRVTQSMYESFHFDQKFRPSRIQQQKIEAGHLGRKSGEGFYKYEE